MENSSKQFAPLVGATSARRRGRTRRGREGKISLVTLIAILGLVVLAGLVGNAGQAVTAKVASQNAADAVAFSSAQWMARGMNAITATNHLIGEVTGLVVVVEGLGGPEMDQRMEDYSPQNRTLDGINRALKDKAPANGLYGANALGNVEKPLINALVDQMAPQSEAKQKSKAFATIYDSKLQLKMDLSKWLLVKTIANLGFYVPPPWGYISAAIAYAAHLYADVQLVEIGKEWFILEGIEIVVRNPLVKQLKAKLEDPLIPALASHGDFIAGRLNNKSQAKPQADYGIVNMGVEDALLHLGQVYDVQAFIFPAARKFRMPIQAEPAPSLAGTTADEPQWGKDEVVTLGDADDTLSKIQENIDDSRSSIQRRIRELREGLQLLDRLEADINNLAKAEGVTPAELETFDAEKREIARARSDKQKRLAKLEKELQDLNRKERELREALDALAKMPPGTGNLSAKRTHLALDKLKQSEERYTQWVRAAHPYVDSFRAPILSQFEKHLERSGAAKHYEKWTNRYTLTKAWQFRSGYRFKAIGGSKTDGQWRKEPSAKPLEMYVMVGAYDKQAPAGGGRRDRKGRELWTEDSAGGRAKAEELFTVIGLTHRDVEPLFSPVIYPEASRRGTTTFAQAIFYNGNQQQPTTGPQPSTQAKLGWDTLNWDPAVAAPEWGTKLASSSAKWPWDIFKKNSTTASSSKVLLNWQAKLMPVTKTRLKGAANMPMSVDMNLNVQAAHALYDNMVTH